MPAFSFGTAPSTITVPAPAAALAVAPATAPFIFGASPLAFLAATPPAAPGDIPPVRPELSCPAAPSVAPAAPTGGAVALGFAPPTLGLPAEAVTPDESVDALVRTLQFSFGGQQAAAFGAAPVDGGVGAVASPGVAGEPALVSLARVAASCASVPALSVCARAKENENEETLKRRAVPCEELTWMRFAHKSCSDSRLHRALR
jgi:hypothetical protein